MKCLPTFEVTVESYWARNEQCAHFDFGTFSMHLSKDVFKKTLFRSSKGVVLHFITYCGMFLELDVLTGIM